MRDDTSVTVATAGQFDWNLVEQIIEPELGALMQGAHEAGALIRRRGVKSASVLLRLILAYACGDASLQQVGLWAARKRSCHQARKKKHKIDQRTLHAAGFCILLTSLSAEAWHSSHVLELYRIRWQIEMHFKRMKSILHLGDIPAHHPDVVQSYLLAQLILALIVEELIMLSGTCGLDGMLPESSPPSLWRLTVTCWESLKNAIRGAPALQPLQLVLPRFRRFLRATPRRRPYQLEQVAALVRAHCSQAVGLPLPCPQKCLS